MFCLAFLAPIEAFIYTMASFVAAMSSASTSGVSLAKAFFDPSGLRIGFN